MNEIRADIPGALPVPARHALNVLLMKPYLTPENSQQAWSSLLAFRPEIEARLSDMNLSLEIDEENEVAFKRQVDSEDGVPKLLRRIPLGRDASLLALWLRREWTSADTQQPLVVTRSQVEEFFHRFAEAGDMNEKRLSDRVDAAISRLQRAALVEQDRDAQHLYLASRAIISIIGIEQIALLTALCGADGGDRVLEGTDTEPEDAA